LLKLVKIKSDSKAVDVTALQTYLSQHPNSKWFSMFKVPLGIYDLSGRDSTKWGNKVLRRLGEEPVVYDSLKTLKSCHDMTVALRNMGYMQAVVDNEVTKKRRKAHVLYKVSPGQKYVIDSVEYVVDDAAVADILGVDDVSNRGLRRGMDFSNANLESERKRITQALTDSGYFKFNRDFIHFVADSLGKDHKVDVELHLSQYRPNNNATPTPHQKYFINKIIYRGADSTGTHLRQRVLENNTALREGEAFSASALQRTYNNFARLQAVRYTNIHFTELPDTNLLDCNIQLSTNKPNTISFQPEGTNTAGDLGAAASLTYENRNLFRGSETLSIQLRAAFEAITGLEGYQNQDYEEYGIEAKLTFPRMIAPFLSRSFRRRSNARSELLFSYNLQNRPEFHRRVLTSAWRYHWSNPRHNSAFRFDLIDINYVHMPWISSTFKEDYLDDVSNRNAILRYNYEDLFILKTGFNFSHNNGHHALRTNFELGGNLLNLLSRTLNLQRNADGQYTLFNIAYAQYMKADFDYTKQVSVDLRNVVAFHFGMGIAWPYGNSKVLPFEKRYFSGGANSVRGWNVRELGPGKFRGTDGRIDFINQTGDMKLDMNVEWRTFLFWKFNAAFFVDAGNIWTLKDYADQPGGQFKINEFYKQIAVAYGLGIRLNLDYFVLRLDLGMKAINPAYTTNKEHYPILHPRFGRDRSLHFAVGLPF
jgi:outer membrane protein assembly factor BamA